MADTKYPQSAETNEYRYIDFEWLDEIAEGLGWCGKASGRNVAGYPSKGTRSTGSAASFDVACW